MAAAEEAVASGGGAAVAGSAAGSSQPAWALGLVAASPAGAAPAEADLAGEAWGEEGGEPAAEAAPPRPAEDGLDLEKHLREQDLYQPTPSPDRPVPLSGRPGRHREPTLIARTPVDLTGEGEEPPRWRAGVGDVVGTVVTDLGATAPTEEATDAAFMLAPSAGSAEDWRLLALTGLALWPWPHRRPQSEREEQDKPVRKSPAPIR